MPRKKRTPDPIGVGMTAKQMRRKKPINTDLMVDVEPITDNQKILFEEYQNGKTSLPMVLPEQAKHLLVYSLHYRTF